MDMTNIENGGRILEARSRIHDEHRRCFQSILKILKDSNAAVEEINKSIEEIIPVNIKPLEPPQ